MRHLKAGRKFNRNPSHRRAMFRHLVGNLFLHEKIETTDAKAKELRRVAERMLTKALRLGDELTMDVGKLSDEKREAVVARRLAAIRHVAADLPHKLARTTPDGDVEEIDLIQKLFGEIAPRYLARVKKGKGGGYTRIIKLNERRGDNAPMAIIELVAGTESSDEDEKPKKKSGGKKKAAKSAEAG